MNQRQHALLARQLIAACGGLGEAARVARLKRSRLAECQDPQARAFLPVDVVADLEAYAGEPLYSRALVAARPFAVSSEGAWTEACHTVEDSAQLLTLVRMAVGRGQGFSPRELAAVETAILKIEAELDQLRNAAEAGDST